MPSAISRPSEPVETVSTSIDRLFLPSRMIEPLPKLRSIWESAASRAFVLSMDDLSTRRSADAPALMIRAPYGRESGGQQRSGPCPSNAKTALYTICSLFAICSFRALHKKLHFRNEKPYSPLFAGGSLSYWCGATGERVNAPWPVVRGL